MPEKLKLAERGTATIQARGGRVFLKVELQLGASLRRRLLKQLKKYKRMSEASKRAPSPSKT
jgi:hypothetical protein